jgi:hypothetical protein
MFEFIQRHRDQVIGILHGFDRLRLRGTKRLLATVGGMLGYLWQRQILLKDFGVHVQQATAEVRQATEAILRRTGRPYLYLQRPQMDKEQVARRLLAESPIQSGLIGILGCVEPCWTYDLHRNRQTRHLDLVARYRKCLHYYHYLLHPVFGFMHVRLQTWYPFTVHVCLNGREWLARQLDRRGIGYVRRQNCLVEVEDVAKAQRLLDLQLRTDWPGTLNGLMAKVNPAEGRLFPGRPVPYYWSAEETEWASDILFRSPEALAAVYPRLIRYAMEHFGSREVLRFLGQKVPATGGVHGCFQGQVTTDLRQRPEGVRIKHQMNRNAVKMYDKQGSVLRVETTINDARGLKTYRPKEGDEQGPKAWRKMRKGVADLRRRAELSQASNERYLAALGGVESEQPLGALAQPVCRRVRWKGRGVRALNPLSAEDGRLLAVIARGEFLISGMRNRDLRAALFGADPADRAEVRRRSGKVTRLLRMLRAHHLIVKVSGTHRYLLSVKSRATVAALIAAQHASAQQLMAAG